MNETSTPPPATGRRQDRFFDWFRGLGIVRGPDSWIGGVCSAIAVRTGLDPLIVRGVFIVVGLFSGGMAILAYAIGWAFLPDGDGKIHAEEVTRGRWEAPSIAILILSVVSLFNRGFWWNGAPGLWGMPDWLQNTLGTGWTLVVIGSIVWFTIWLVRNSREQRRPNVAPPAPAPPYGAPETRIADSAGYDPATAAADARANAARLRAEAEEVRRQARAQARGAQPEPEQLLIARQEAATAKAEARRIRREAEARAAAEHAAAWRRRRPGGGFVVILLGLAALCGGVAALLTAPFLGSSTVLLAGGIAALAVLALGMIVSGVRGKVGGALSGFAFLLVVLIAIGTAVPRDSSLNVFGPSPSWRPASVSASTDERHTVLVGSPVLDLSRVSSTSGSTGASYEIWLGAGRMVIDVPDGLTVRVETDSVLGGINVDGFDSDAVTRDRAGFFFGDTQTVGPNGSADVTVAVHSVVGSVDVREVTR